MSWSIRHTVDRHLPLLTVADLPRHQNDGLLDVVQQLSHALEDAAKTEDEMRLVNANMQANQTDQRAEMSELHGAVAIQRNLNLSTKCLLAREKVPREFALFR